MLDILEAIKSRRSIRRYRTEPVDDKNVETVLEAARWAPSWANTQCWRFIVVRDSKVKAELARALPDDNPAQSSITSAPLVIVACAELGMSGYKDEKLETNKGDWYMFDVALAMQNLTLVAHSLGLATVHVGRFNAERAEAILGVPPGFCVVEMTPLGYPDQQRNPRPRKELSEIVFYDRYGKSYPG